MLVLLFYPVKRSAVQVLAKTESAAADPAEVPLSKVPPPPTPPPRQMMP